MLYLIIQNNIKGGRRKRTYWLKILGDLFENLTTLVFRAATTEVRIAVERAAQHQEEEEDQMVHHIFRGTWELREKQCTNSSENPIIPS